MANANAGTQTQAAREQKIQSHVAIIGAGPAGTATALRLARNGVTDVVLADSADFPRDKTCGSGLSPRGIEAAKELGVWSRLEARAYPICGLRLFTRGGREASVSGGAATQAAICLRREMDYEILKAALELDVRFVSYFRASQPILRGGRWVGIRASDGREIMADYVVVANGAHSKLTASDRPKRLIHTCMGWYEGISFPENHVEMYWDKMLTPYYGWLFPESEKRVNIGITYEEDGSRTNARERFRLFLDKHFASRLRQAKQIGNWKGHPILYTYRLGNLGSPGRFVVGEAGRMTHPATGEGISQAMRSGMFAADALSDIMLCGRSESLSLREYERKCARAFLPSFWVGRAFRQVIQTPVLDWISEFGMRPAVKKTVADVLARL
jgi:flavin-dependent dehydrogenase